jgi:hypothetical protein
MCTPGWNSRGFRSSPRSQWRSNSSSLTSCSMSTLSTDRLCLSLSPCAHNLWRMCKSKRCPRLRSSWLRRPGSYGPGRYCCRPPDSPRPCTAMWCSPTSGCTSRSYSRQSCRPSRGSEKHCCSPTLCTPPRRCMPCRPLQKTYTAGSCRRRPGSAQRRTHCSSQPSWPQPEPRPDNCYCRRTPSPLNTERCTRYFNCDN